MTKGRDKNETASAAAPVHADARFSRILAPVRDEHHLPADRCDLKGKRLVAIGALGIRKIGSSEPILVTDQVHLGSCTSAMTATMIGTLIDVGKLSFGTTISQVFPEAAPGLHLDLQSVTLSQLLTHRAASPNAHWWHLSGETTTEKRRDLLARCSATTPPVAGRGPPTPAPPTSATPWPRLVAEQVTGLSWEALMRERVFEPLGMLSAGFGPPGHPDRVDQPWGHHPSGSEIRPTRQDNAPPAMGPAAACIAPCPTGPSSPRYTCGVLREGLAVETGHRSGPCILLRRALITRAAGRRRRTRSLGRRPHPGT